MEENLHISKKNCIFAKNFEERTERSYFIGNSIVKE